MATLAFVGSMAVLGAWIQARIEEDWRESATASTARFLDDFISDHVRQMTAHGDPRSAEAVALLRTEIADALRREFAAVTVWTRSGVSIFSAPEAGRDERLPEDVRALVLAGRSVMRPIGSYDHERGSVMRVFAPVHDPDNGTIAAIAAADQWSSEIERDARIEGLESWPIIGLATVVMLGLLYLLVNAAAGTIDRQHAALVRQSRRARALSRRSSAMMNIAEHARHDAVVAIEKTLARIGSDIHDGPIQRLAILALRLDDDTASARLGEELQTVVAELRDITCGLALPELSGLGLEGAIRLAVVEHEKITGVPVALTLGPLPLNVRKSVRVSAFRIVQEALSNGFRHGGGAGQAVHAAAAEGTLLLTISDAGPGLSPGAAKPGKALLGSLSSRVDAMRGEIRVEAGEPRGLKLVVALPLGLRPVRPDGDGAD